MSWKWQLVLVLMTAGVCSGRGALIAGWNFNDQTAGVAGSPITAEHGSGSLDLSHFASMADETIGSGGTGINKISGDVNGHDFYVQAGTAEIENGASMIFSLSTSGYENIVLTYATFGTSTGFTTQQWSYSTDGGANYMVFFSVTPNTSYTSEPVDFSSVSDINDASSILFELTLDGASGSSNGSDHFDNIQFNGDAITPVPEYPWLGLMSGAGLLGVCVLHVWCQRRRRNSATPI